MKKYINFLAKCIEIFRNKTYKCKLCNKDHGFIIYHDVNCIQIYQKDCETGDFYNSLGNQSLNINLLAFALSKKEIKISYLEKLYNSINKKMNIE